MNELDTDWKLEAPSLTLFAFHLRNDITKGSQEEMVDPGALWDQCVAFGKDRNISNLKSLKSKLRGYTRIGYDNYKHMPAKEDKDATEAEEPYLDDWLELVRLNPKPDQARQLALDDPKQGVKGKIYPLRIHDTYAVDLTLRYQETVDFDKLKFLNPTGIKGSLGQTLVLFAKPVNVPEDKYQDFANKCVKELLQGDLKPSAVGKLFGSPIFEYDNEKEEPPERRHVLVWLNCHPKTLPRIEEGQAYHALLNLLCCRSKILYAYYQSRLCDRNAQSFYSELESQINKVAEL